MEVNSTFPYVEEQHGTESNGHIYLKNMAVHWLLSRGFTIDDIELEKTVYRKSRRTGYPAGQTDVYASNGAVEAFVECETDFTGTENGLSGGGKVPAKEGKAVFVFTDEAIYRVKQVTFVATNQYGTRPREFEALDFEPLSAPPMLPTLL